MPEGVVVEEVRVPIERRELCEKLGVGLGRGGMVQSGEQIGTVLCCQAN